MMDKVQNPSNSVCLVFVSTKSNIYNYPYHSLFAFLGYNGETKWKIWPCVQEQYGPFPGGDLISASIDVNTTVKLYTDICSL
jgi:hypothetical protein